MLLLVAATSQLYWSSISQRTNRESCESNYCDGPESDIRLRFFLHGDGFREFLTLINYIFSNQTQLQLSNGKSLCMQQETKSYYVSDFPCDHVT